MKVVHRRTGVAAAVVAALATAVALLGNPGGASADVLKPPATVAGLKVLLTNDDSVQDNLANGSAGRGLYELRHALCAAGADVVVVGPWAQQSGAGGKITVDSKAKMTIQPVTPPDAYVADCAAAPSGGRVYGACIVAAPCTADSPTATPADTVQIALNNFIRPNFWATGPDLVLTGINFGQNTGITTFHSGTTSAAVTAHQYGAPAIAFSEALPGDTPALIACYTQNVGCPTYTAAAAFAVTLIGKLRGAGLIQPATLLNVNYPHVADGQTVGKPVVNVLGVGESLATGWSGSVGVDGGSYGFGLGTPIKETRKNADTTAIAKGKISIVPLDGDWTATASPKLTAVVKALG